jgi:hypothetical protein
LWKVYAQTFLEITGGQQSDDQLAQLLQRVLTNRETG